MFPSFNDLENRYGVRAGSINPNLFQAQDYKYGSICNPDRCRSRARPTAHARLRRDRQAPRLAAISLRGFADGSNYPGTQSIRDRIAWMEEAFAATHAALAPSQRLLIEYKPFEPAFYHTDIADWGMALELARAAGPQARVLVDTGHHYQSQNIEQIVAWLLHRRYARRLPFQRPHDMPTTISPSAPSIPTRCSASFTKSSAIELKPRDTDIAYMIDQSHNLKGKIEAMMQTVATAQELYAKAALVDRERLADLQRRAANWSRRRSASAALSGTDVRPAVRAWRKGKGLPEDPLQALAESGYVQQITQERAAKNAKAITSYA